MIPDVLASTAGGSVPGFYGKNRAWYESIQSSSQMGAAQVKSQVKNRMSLTVQLFVPRSGERSCLVCGDPGSFGAGARSRAAGAGGGDKGDDRASVE